MKFQIFLLSGGWVSVVWSNGVPLNPNKANYNATRLVAPRRAVETSVTSIPTVTGVQANISYHSGEINVGVTSIYNVFYGDWSGALPHSDSVAVDIFNTFSANIGATPWYNILTTYWETGGSTPTSAVFDGYYFINSTSYPTSLSTNDIIDVLSIAAYQGAIPVSPGSSDNVYLFIVSEGNVPLRLNR